MGHYFGRSRPRGQGLPGTSVSWPSPLRHYQNNQTQKQILGFGDGGFLRKARTQSQSSASNHGNPSLWPLGWDHLLFSGTAVLIGVALTDCDVGEMRDSQMFEPQCRHLVCHESKLQIHDEAVFSLLLLLLDIVSMICFHCEIQSVRFSQ